MEHYAEIMSTLNWKLAGKKAKHSAKLWLFNLEKLNNMIRIWVGLFMSNFVTYKNDQKRKKCFEYNRNDEWKTLMIKVHTKYAKIFLEQKKNKKNNGRADVEAKKWKENEYFMNCSRNLNKAEEVSVAQSTLNSSNTIKISQHSYIFLVLDAYLLQHVALLPGSCGLTFTLLRIVKMFNE